MNEYVRKLKKSTQRHIGYTCTCIVGSDHLWHY